MPRPPLPLPRPSQTVCTDSLWPSGQCYYRRNSLHHGELGCWRGLPLCDSPFLDEVHAEAAQRRQVRLVVERFPVMVTLRLFAAAVVLYPLKVHRTREKEVFSTLSLWLHGRYTSWTPVGPAAWTMGRLKTNLPVTPVQFWCGRQCVKRNSCVAVRFLHLLYLFVDHFH